MGKLLDSSNMFKLNSLRWLSWAFPKSSIVLQDFLLPRSNAAAFHNTIQHYLDVWPIWLLPVAHVSGCDGSLFSGPSGPGHTCDVGVYGIPKKPYRYVESNKNLEALLEIFQGRKMYYSHSFYDRDHFYSTLHNGCEYFKLRDKYGAKGIFPDIYEKTHTKEGEL